MPASRVTIVKVIQSPVFFTLAVSERLAIWAYSFLKRSIAKESGPCRGVGVGNAGCLRRSLRGREVTRLKLAARRN